MKIRVLFHEGWLGILLASIALVDAVVATREFFGARFLVYLVIAFFKKHDRALTVEVYLTGAFVAGLIAICALNTPQHLFAVTCTYLMVMSLLFAYLSLRRLHWLTTKTPRATSEKKQT